GKCGCLGASGLGGGSADTSRPSCSSRPARASRPKPLPTRWRNSRRERYSGGGGAKSLRRFISVSLVFGFRLASITVSGPLQEHSHLVPVVSWTSNSASRIRLPVHADLS